MKIFRNTEDYNIENSYLTIGTFDGLHLGHKSLIDSLKTAARKTDAKTTVLTFWPHPRMVLSKSSSDLKLLNTIDERIWLFEKTKIDNLIIYPFTKEFSKIEAKDFIEKILVNKLNIKGLVIGYDHQFGYKRKGEVNCIAEAAKKYGFYLEQIKAFSQENINVSSTNIRNALAEGNISLAEKYLSYKYFISGKVIHGKKIGRNIGFPTANIQTESYKLIPGKGVYAVKFHFREKVLLGMMNIGNKPTVNNSDQNLTIEVNIFNFDENIYNKFVKIELLEKIRNEKKFDTLEALKIQINKDRQTILNKNYS